MRIKYSDIFLNVNKPEDFNRSFINIFFLHGFTGSSRDWKPILPGINNRFNKFAIDLIGHGNSNSPDDLSYYSMRSQVEQINKIISHFTKDKIILVGYSMGGRASLCYASAYPERMLGLILESASGGIKDKNQRDKRITEDAELAEFISSHSIEEFTDLWMNKELFATQLRFSDSKRKEIRKNKLRNNPVGLSNSLQGFSTGKMSLPDNKLNNLPFKTLLITGELDTKFTYLNKKLVNKFPSAIHKIIKNSGHTVHLEEPENFILTINRFLAKF
jgi:2-succinyl-6-hydroxy-2,4-cyclohexadiene-1-carboxylate synthase